MDRSKPEADRAQQCQRLCATYGSQKPISGSYHTTLLRSIEGFCAPVDVYVACIYHTMKFDVIDE
ncbi:unnamed protein product [Gongylonema pulchrum]|uniref:Uncharacterized protein n=1 Tax=Gongylonema pulchrum TaxID=637853 RepID=A0A183EB70_9BILA|nr:unnamed protein product [Gongylonema pulchrum]